MFKTCSNMFKCVQTCSKLVQMCSNVFKRVQNLFKCVRTCLNLFKTCSNVIKWVQICSKLFQMSSNVFKWVNPNNWGKIYQPFQCKGSDMTSRAWSSFTFTCHHNQFLRVSSGIIQTENMNCFYQVQVFPFFTNRICLK